MAATKRATWIEGITKSNRILRDLAEILTTAVKDEMGVSATENWKLVYPRPFEEYKVNRGTLLQDASLTRQYVPVMDRQEFIVLYDDIDAELKYNDIEESTLVVKSEDLSVTYKLGVDYDFDVLTKKISRIDTGAIVPSSRLQAFYGTKVSQILDSVSVKVEKVLTIADPDRVIDPAEYTIDYTTGEVRLNVTPHSDAEYYSLTFTDIQGPYTRVRQEKLRLDVDPLDPTGQTLRIPSSALEIGNYPVHTKVIASALTGTTGLGGSTIVYTIDGAAHTVKFTLGTPSLEPDQSLWVTVYEYLDPPVNSTWAKRRFQLTPEGTTPGLYKIIGATNGLHTGVAHSVEVDTNTVAPVLYKHLSSLHAGYEELPQSAYRVDFENPRVIVFMDITEELRLTFFARGKEDLPVGFDKITDRVVLCTTTEPEQVFEQGVASQYGAEDTAESLKMYVELYKPAKLVNPETGLTRYIDWKGVQRETSDNNHYIQVRMFDKWDDEIQKPKESVYGTGGALLEQGANVSDWAKYSWLRDWKESMIDELDDDPGTSNVVDGLIFHEIEINGVNSDFPIQMWVSTNNNRAAIVLMGDPTLDQDNFLTSFGYLGRIHPFYDKACVVKKDESGTILLDEKGDPIIEEKRTYFQNDVAGNFAMSFGSSTMPVAIGAPPTGTPTVASVDIAVDDVGDLVPGSLYDYSAFSYLVTYLTDSGESRPTSLTAGRVLAPMGAVDSSLVPTEGIAVRLVFSVPNEATGYRVYRAHQANTAVYGPVLNTYSNYKLVTSATKIDKRTNIEFIDKGDILQMYKSVYNTIASAYDKVLLANSTDPFYAKTSVAASTSRSFEAVLRDKYTGAVLSVEFSKKWGKDTATGVNDIMMYGTRSSLRYQRHFPSFNTSEEFISKEKSGQSRWTGKFHLTPIYVEHSYDKQRGWLDGVMSVDDSGIEHLDDLIVDKDTANEEVYKFFRINAPYSLFNNSANYAYGIAIIKSSLRW